MKPSSFVCTHDCHLHIAALDGILAALRVQVQTQPHTHDHDKRATGNEYRGMPIDPQFREFGGIFPMHPDFHWFPPAPPEDEEMGHSGHGFGSGFGGWPYWKSTQPPESTPISYTEYNFEEANHSAEFLDQYKWATLSFLNGMDRYTYPASAKPMASRIRYHYLNNAYFPSGI